MSSYAAVGCDLNDPDKDVARLFLRLTDRKLGLLINFGASLIKEGIFRIVNGLEE